MFLITFYLFLPLPPEIDLLLLLFLAIELPSPRPVELPLFRSVVPNYRTDVSDVVSVHPVLHPLIEKLYSPL